MGINPYLTPEDESAEIVGEEESSDSTETINGAQRQVIRGPNGEELPREVQDALGRSLNAWDNDATSKIPPEFRAIQGIYEFFSSFSSFQESGTLLLAVAEVVDILSDGGLGRVYQLHEAERKIMWTHSILRLENVLESLLDLMNIDVHNAYREELRLYFTTFMKFVRWYQDCAINEYTHACKELEREPDHEFVSTGTLTTRTHYQKIAMGHPIAKRDV